MSKLTVEVPEERRRALKATAARRGLTIAQLVDESLRLNGVRTESEVEGLMERLRANATLSEADALAFGVRVTREVRSE
ncbi:MAG: CopG family transcriptional regulator [Gammaproteobacteria bacterium]|nr:CopG family transcriptional regulator [Gammaproteobacteria bacterium]